MNTFRVTYTDGSNYVTNANGTLKEFTDYLMQFGGVVTDENPVTGEETHRQIEKVEQVLKGLRCSIYRDDYDCPLNLTDARNLKHITLVGPGLPEVFEADDEAPAFMVVTRNIQGEYKHIEPVERPTGTGWMYGGHIAYTSDGRFPNRYPLKIHDRQEF